MEIYVNNNKIDYKPLFPLTWGDLFREMIQKEKYLPKSHGIVRIVADDVEFLQEMTNQTDQMVPEDIKILHIFTKNSVAITRDGFEKMLTLIESIKVEISSAADFYREGNVEEASTKIVNIMEAIKPMINFIQSVGISFLLDFEEILFDQDTTLSGKIESFLNTLQELVAAQIKRDYVGIADYLEYYLFEDMTDWSKMVNILIKEVEASTSKS